VREQQPLTGICKGLLARLIHLPSCRCTSGFNIDGYDQDLELVTGVKLRDLNTQICEQTNSVLQRISTSVSIIMHFVAASCRHEYAQMITFRVLHLTYFHVQRSWLS
jgi:hypothetical protein